MKRFAISILGSETFVTIWNVCVNNIITKRYYT